MMNYNTFFYQGYDHARHDITEMGIEYAEDVAGTMRFDGWTPYADGYKQCVEDERGKT